MRDGDIFMEKEESCMNTDKLKALSDGLSALYNEVPQEIRTKYHLIMQDIFDELNKNRMSYVQKIYKRNLALGKIANTYGKQKFGTRDNRECASEMRKIAREALNEKDD